VTPCARHVYAALTFFLVFAADVRVKAHVVEAPKNCSKSKNVCAILNDSGVLRRKMSWGSLRVSEGSSYIVVSETELRLIRGHFLIAAEKPVKVSSLYGDFKALSGQSYFDVKDQIVSFTNLTASLKYQPLGETQFYDLPAGFMNYLTLVNSQGIAEAGYPRLAELRPLIKGWGELFSSAEIGKFRADYRQFSESWSKAQKVVGPWYTQTVEREIAAEKSEEDRQARLREQHRLESAKWRDLFHERNYLGVDPGDTHD
jgi:hypothetical protein